MRRIAADCLVASGIKSTLRHRLPLTMPAVPPSPSAKLSRQASGLDNLRLLQWLRDFAIAGLALVVILAEPLFHTLVPLTPAFSLLGLWIAISAFTWRRMRHAPTIGDGELLLHVGIDVAMLTLLLAFSGGPANPLTALYLPPVAVAAAVLPTRLAWLVAVFSIVAYSLLWKFSVPLTVEDAGRAMQMHLNGMWLTFAASALLIAGFVTRITSALRERERQLAMARERTLRDERIVALGNLAAGAAHELGTPLATMVVIVGELDRASGMPEELRPELKLLGEQIGTCKHIISGLAERGGLMRAEGGATLAIDRWIEQVVAYWRSLRPQIIPRLTLASAREDAPRIFGEETLQQALLNLFNNAADASPGDVEIIARWTSERLQMEILDRGPGIAAALLQQAGREFFSTRREGAGIGLFLAHATLNRYGGGIHMENRAGGGMLTRVDLPLNALQENGV